jgi:hypothetical protein
MVIIWLMMFNNNLVGGFNHLEKILVNGKDYPIYHGKKMFETTYQFFVYDFYRILSAF